MLKKIIAVFQAVVLVLALTFAVTSVEKVSAAPYTPKLPKMPATTSVVVLDLTKDKSEHTWQTTEALLAIATIQGIVNRTSSAKIYLTHSPQKWCGNYDPANVDQFALDDGMVPVTKIYPTLDNTKRFPVLSYLLANYSSYIKGKIYYPNLSLAVNDSAVMGAVTACAQTDSIPVSSTIDAYMIAEGKNFTVKEDCRNFGTDEIAAFRWAKANYFNANTTRAFIAKHGFKYWGGGPALHPTTFDYYVASKAFIYSLDANIPAQASEIPSLLNTANYPAGTPVLGESNGELGELEAIHSKGYYFIFTDGANYSVHSSFPSNPAAITAPRAPTASSIVSNGAYIAFYVTDGDNLSIAQYKQYDYWRNSPQKGQVAMGWSLPPILFDIYPKRLEWFSNNNYNNAYELVSDFDDGIGPDTTAGRTGWQTDYKNYLDNTNGLFRTLNFFGDNTTLDGVLNYIRPYMDITGYQGRSDGQDSVNWSTLDNKTITKVNIVGATQSWATASNIAFAAQSAVNRVAAGTPAFVLVCVGDGGHGGDAAANAKAAMDLLKANPQGRNYQFLRPQDLTATWRAWKGYDTPSPTPTPGTATDYEAESATLSSGVASFANSSASGGYIAGSFDQAGESILFNSVVSGSQIIIRYANGTNGPRRCSLYVNGSDAATVNFAQTANWDTFSTVTVNVPINANVKLQIDGDDASYNGGAGNAAANVDKITIVS